MVAKIQMLEARILELEDLVYKARNGRGSSELKHLESLLILNTRILAMLREGYPVYFYKPQVSDISLEDASAKGFFLTKADIVAPFMSVWN